MTFVCPHDRTPLDASLHCATCGRTYPIDDGIADFSEGNYYDVFDPSMTLPDEHRRGLEQEVFGTRTRIEQFYLPTLRRGERVLDAGCGNGLAVDLLADAGHEAWGIDLSALRKWQWRERVHRDRLAVASALALPFPDRAFDVVISSGVIEHIGVAETGGATYSVRPLPDRDALRARYVAELLRVGRRVFIDCPNGAFPIDFWHNAVGGKARWHRRDEGFLPTYRELASLVHDVAPDAKLRALSPHRRFAFQQVSRHWYGRVGALPIALWFRVMGVVPRLARTALNPFLVVEITR